MAVKLESSTRRYIGLSTDVKPLFEDSDNLRVVPDGSSFLESDTGTLYRKHQNEWRAVPKSEDANELLFAILSELQTIRVLMESNL